MFQRSPIKSRRGGIIPMVAILLPVTVTIAAFAINIAYLELNRTEMYVAADAAARAAGREYALTWDQKKAIEAGKKAAAQNTVGGKPLTLADSDFIFGEATRVDEKSRYTFVKGGSNPNAVEVSIRRTKGSSNGMLTSLMPIGKVSGDFEAVVSSRVNQVEADIALVIDRSGSMAYAADERAVYPPLPKSAPPTWFFGQEAPPVCRWRDAVSSVDVFLKELSKTPMKETVALITYANSAGTDQGLTTDYKKINDGLDKYTKAFSSGATNIAGGLAGGQTILTSVGARTFSAKVLVLLTDGIDTTGSDLVKAAKSAAEKKIMIFTVTFSDEADQTTMKKVAEAGLGNHYHAKNASDLQKIFLDIARQIPVLITK
jgi:Mg-chelatase subunit ChlD